MLPEKEAKAITLQIVQGLAYLNEAPRHIIHYDLKPANILFDSFGQAKITVRVPLPALMASSGLCRPPLHHLQPSLMSITVAMPNIVAQVREAYTGPL